MSRMTWRYTGARKRYVSKVAVAILNEWQTAKKELAVMFGDDAPGLDVDVAGVMDRYIEEFAFNTEWCTRRTWAGLERDVIREVVNLTASQRDWIELNRYIKGGV